MTAAAGRFARQRRVLRNGSQPAGLHAAGTFWAMRVAVGKGEPWPGHEAVSPAAAAKAFSTKSPVRICGRMTGSPVAG